MAKNITVLDQCFNLSYKKKLTKQQIEDFSSAFLVDLIDPYKKDLFKLSEINKNDNSAKCKIEIYQQNIHPFSEGGFHLSAVPVCEFIDLFIRKIYEKKLLLDLLYLEMFCNRPVRKKKLKPTISINNKLTYNYSSKDREGYSNDITNVSYDIENSSFNGNIQYNSKKYDHLLNNNFKISPDLSKHNSFNILDFFVKGLEVDAKLSFTCETLSTDGFVLGPGLALTICSQLVIIHIYAISDSGKKNKGVVVSNFKFICNKNIISPNTINFRSKIKKISSTNNSEKYVKTDVDCFFNDGDCKAELTYYFEPFS